MNAGVTVRHTQQIGEILMNKKLVAAELDSRFTSLLMILFSWVAPIGIGIIFVYGLISG